ncbi:aldehyde dehydrogenase [Salipiger abyssi]|uniref:Aldehyde dehydrogenase (NAD+) n=1 Tax=Salipiger abyssi TaxID=1250539 RepID=A0A1P8USA2_9RHOB|nr:aldehyde dehydrogenase [Salipiger abyssi]APZ52208.1 aldehyde dehydrogenase (NAD+) [Salipiger abyssi]
MTLDRLQNYIGGAFQPPLSDAWMETENPYSAAAWGLIPRSGAEDASAAVAAAKQAFESGPWAEASPTARAGMLRRIAAVVAENAEELARIEVRDNGKTFAEMHAQVQRIPDWYNFYAGLADKIGGELLPEARPGHMTYVRHEPLGVIAMITPWNSPLMLLAWKLAPALAAGNTAVVKPSEFTTASALRFAGLVGEAGLPAGVLNVVGGLGAEVGAALTGHPDVAKVAFTGGVSGGRAVYAAAAQDLKPVSLELGGKSPNIVFGDADLELAARGVVSGIFGSGGQSCVAGSRLLVQRDLHDAFVARVVELTEKIRLGDPMSPETDIGPVANRPQFDRIMTCIGWALEDGATCVTGGTQVQDPEGGPGLFVAPTVFTGVSNDMRIAREEVFGPVLSVIPFDGEAEAVAIANDSPFGLGAGLWTRDVARVHRVAARLQAGSVWVNTYKATSQIAPFGGYKASGLGREGGVEMIADYLQTKSVWLNLTGEVPYGFPL